MNNTLYDYNKAWYDYLDLKREAIKKLNDIWDIILFDGFEIINCCAIPKEMHETILSQIADELYSYYIALNRIKLLNRPYDTISPKIDKLIKRNFCLDVERAYEK